MKKTILALTAALSMIAGHVSFASEVPEVALQALKTPAGEEAMKSLLNLSGKQITSEMIAAQLAKTSVAPNIEGAISRLAAKLADKNNTLTPEQAVKSEFFKNGALIPANQLKVANATTGAVQMTAADIFKNPGSKPIVVPADSIMALADQLKLPARLAQQLKATGNNGNAFTGQGCDKLITFGVHEQEVYAAARIAYANEPKAGHSSYELSEIALAKALNAVSKNEADPDVLSESMPSAATIAAMKYRIDHLASSECLLVNPTVVAN